MATTPITRSQSRLDLIWAEAEDKTALQGLLWEPQKAGDSLVVMVPGGTTGAALFPAHDYSPRQRAHGQRLRVPALQHARLVQQRLRGI